MSDSTPRPEVAAADREIGLVERLRMGGPNATEVYDQAADEIERLWAMLEKRWKDAHLLSAGPDGIGAFSFAIRSDLAGLMAEHLAQIMKAEGAPNFVSIEADHPEMGPLTFSVERRFGQSAASQLAAAKEQISALESSLSAHKACVEALAFYADPESYHGIMIMVDRPAGEFADDLSEDHGHEGYDRPMPGKRARKALAALKALEKAGSEQ